MAISRMDSRARRKNHVQRNKHDNDHNNENQHTRQAVIVRTRFLANGGVHITHGVALDSNRPKCGRLDRFPSDKTKPSRLVGAHA